MIKEHIQNKTTYDYETDINFYCEDGAVNACEHDCRDCSIYGDWWKAKHEKHPL